MSLTDNVTGIAGTLFRSDWNFKTSAGGPAYVDLRDVARAHVLAVQRAEANGKRLLLVRRIVLQV